MLADVIRKIVPMRPRQEVGTWLAYKVARSGLLTVAFYYLLFGIKLEEKVKLLLDDNCAIAFDGVEIVMARDGIFSFIDVFRECVYEQFDSPREGDIVMDIGAYVGMFTIKASKLVGDKGLVIAIEPEPKNLTLLQRNIESYNLHNVKIVGKAALDKETKMPLFLQSSRACHSLFYRSGNHIEIEADSPDNIASKLGLDHVDFIKIDAEGSELEILKGSEKLLDSPDVRLSIASYHDLPNGQPEMPAIVSYLVSRGFQIQLYKKSYVYATKQGYGTAVH